MNKEINQKISQFIDDELHHTELDNLLSVMKQQPQLKNTMHRYQTVSHVLSSEDALIANGSFLDKIKYEIKHEQHHFVPKKNSKNRQLGFWPEISIAMAASVVIIAITVSQQVDVTDVQSSQVLAKTPVENIQMQAKNTTQISQHDRFKAYLLAHSDDLYTHGSLDYQPLARVVHFSQK